MNEFFGREATLIAGTLKVTGLRISFKIEKTLKREPNKAEISVWNLAQSTRASLRGVKVPVTLTAGYRGNAEVIFMGDVADISSTKDGTDWVTMLKVGDGEKVYRSARVSESLAAGASMKDALQKVLKSFGASAKTAVDKVKAGDISGALTGFVSGTTLSGDAAGELSKLLAANGYEWSIQDGKVQILKAGEATTDPMIMLSASSGLIGSPEPGKGGAIKFRSLLQPGLRPGRRVQIKSREIDGGIFIVGKVVHNGDTHEKEWFSNVEEAYKSP